jgi:hypothetical protein
MNNEEKLKLREKLFDDLLAAIDDARVDIGSGLTASDIVGILEWMKMRFYQEASGNALLDFTSMAMD